MKCSEFEEGLGGYLAGDLPRRKIRRAEAHATRCPRCRRLMQIASGELDILSPAMEEDLARSILDRTSGDLCFRALENWCESAPGGDTPENRELREHLARCPECAATAGILKELETALPDLAEIDPGPSFTRNVLRATSSARGAGAGPERKTVREIWFGLVRRPRFEWEAAYVAALLLVFVFGGSLDSARGTWFRLETASTERLHSVTDTVAAQWIDPLELDRITTGVIERKESIGRAAGDIKEHSSELAGRAVRLEKSAGTAFQKTIGGMLRKLHSVFRRYLPEEKKGEASQIRRVTPNLFPQAAFTPIEENNYDSAQPVKGEHDEQSSRSL